MRNVQRLSSERLRLAVRRCRVPEADRSLDEGPTADPQVVRRDAVPEASIAFCCHYRLSATSH